MTDEERKESESTTAAQAEATTETPELDVQVEDTGPCEKTVTITAEPEYLKTRYQQSVDELVGTVRIPGFRPGRAPRGLVEQRVGPTVKSQMKSEIVQEGLEQAASELHTVGPPIAPDVESMPLDMDEAFSVQVTVEVLPEFEAEDYKGLKVERPVVEITDEDVEQEIKQVLRRYAGRLVELPEGHMEPENYGECDVEVYEGDNLIWSAEEQPLHMQREMLGPISIPGLAEEATGMRIGEEKTVSTKLDQDFPVPEHAGKDVTVKFKVTAIRKLQVPPLTDETAEKLGFEGMEAMKQNFRTRMEERRDSMADDAIRNQLVDKLLEKNELELPPRLVQRHTQEHIRRTQVNLLRQGYTMNDMAQLSDEISEQSKGSVIRSLQASLLLKDIADREKIFVTEDEIDNYIRELAHREGMSEINMRRALERGDLISTIRSRLREEKVRDFLLQHAEVEEKEVPRESENTEEGSQQESDESSS